MPGTGSSTCAYYTTENHIRANFLCYVDRGHKSFLLVCAIAKIEQLMDKFSKLSKKSVFFRVNPRPKKSSTKGIV